MVGVHSDGIVGKVKGEHYPICNLYERVFAVLSCGVVDDIIIGK